MKFEFVSFKSRLKNEWILESLARNLYENCPAIFEVQQKLFPTHTVGMELSWPPFASHTVKFKVSFHSFRYSLGELIFHSSVPRTITKSELHWIKQKTKYGSGAGWF